jgi:hypothetical protein
MEESRLRSWVRAGLVALALLALPAAAWLLFPPPSPSRLARTAAAPKVAPTAPAEPTAKAPRPRASARPPTARPSASARPAGEAGLGSIEGVVVDANDQPVREATVSVVVYLSPADESPSVPATASVEDARGRFVLRGLPAGTYVLGATAPGQAPGRSASIELGDGEAATGAKIVVAAGARVRGKVTDAASGKPLEGAKVALDPLGPASHPDRTSTTSADGAYSIDGVPRDGPFALRVSLDGYRTSSVTLDAPSGDLEHDVPLTARGEGGPSSEYGGIGIMLGAMMGVRPTVGGFLPDSPAQAAGLERGDVIMEIDGQPTQGLAVQQSMLRLRGVPGTAVSIRVARGDKELTFTVTRTLVVR